MYWSLHLLKRASPKCFTGIVGHTSDTAGVGIVMQSPVPTLRIGDHCPAIGHGVHAEAAPASALYVPVGQEEHGPPAGPKKPAAHVQLVMLALPVGAPACSGQGRHVPEKKTDSPTVVE